MNIQQIRTLPAVQVDRRGGSGVRWQMDRGYAAAECGAKQEDNPHARGTVKRAAWDRGWRESNRWEADGALVAPID